MSSHSARVRVVERAVALALAAAVLVLVGCGGEADRAVDPPDPGTSAQSPNPQERPDPPVQETGDEFPAPPPEERADPGEPEYRERADAICALAGDRYETALASVTGPREAVQEFAAAWGQAVARLRALEPAPGSDLADRVYDQLEARTAAVLAAGEAAFSNDTPALDREYDRVLRLGEELDRLAREAGFRVCGLLNAPGAGGTPPEVSAEWIERGELIANAAGLISTDPYLEDLDPAAAETLVREGASLFRQAGCLNCHVYQGAGTENLGAPWLTREGQRGRGIEFQIEHLRDPGSRAPGSLMPSFATLSDEQLLALAVFLEASQLEPDPGGAAAARQLWASHSIDDYTLTLLVGRREVPDPLPCGLVGELTVVVEGGEPIEATEVHSGCEIKLATAPPPLTIDDLFELIDVAAAGTRDIHVEFDPELGYPILLILFEGDPLSVDVLALNPTGEEPRPDVRERRDELDRRRQQWQQAGISDYSYTVKLTCQVCVEELGGPFDVTVTDGETAEIRYHGNPIEPDTFVDVYTIEQLFALIERRLSAHTLTISYHDELGYPVQIDVDPLQYTVDEEHAISVSTLKPNS